MSPKPSIPKNTCFGCKNIIETRHFLKCAHCENVYDVCCTNVSEPRFRNIMSKENKDKWMCQICKDVTASKNNNVPSPSISNVTLRKKKHVTPKKTYAALSEDEEFDSSSSSIFSRNCSKLNRSCPEIGEDLQGKINALNETINELQNQLRIAEQEIENLLMENKSLLTKIDDYSAKIKTLNNICKSDTLLSSSRSRRNSKSKITFTPKACASMQNDGILHVDEDDQSSELRTVTELVSALENKSRSSNVHQENGAAGPEPESRNDRSSSLGPKSNKLCILNTSKHNRILPIAEYILGGDYEVCHFLYPGVGLRTLLHNIDGKLKHFTKDDFCFIFIGEEDFRKSENYHSLVLHIRNTLSGLTHTNVVVCCPIFNMGQYATMYNFRVESFNKLLYFDIKTHNYAYLLDSNRNLTYDFDMFYYKTGSIKNSGLRTVFRDMSRLMYIIIEENNSSDTCNGNDDSIIINNDNKGRDSHNSSKFFRKQE